MEISIRGGAWNFFFDFPSLIPIMCENAIRTQPRAIINSTSWHQLAKPGLFRLGPRVATKQLSLVRLLNSTDSISETIPSIYSLTKLYWDKNYIFQLCRIIAILIFPLSINIIHPCSNINKCKTVIEYMNLNLVILKHKTAKPIHFLLVEIGLTS